MTRKRAALTYLILLFILVVIAAWISLYRGDLRPFDPKLTMGLTVISVLNAIKSFGLIIGANLIISFFIKRPAYVVAWIIPGTLLVLAAHFIFGAHFSLTPLSRIGWLDGFLFYLPSVGLLSLIGGFLGQMAKPN